MASLSPRQELIEEVKLMLGGGVVDLELDPPHYNLGFNRSLLRYRQRSGNALEESFLFLDVQPEVSVYTLPTEVQEVRAIYRRTIGATAGGAAIDPFSLSFTNNMYMMQNPGGLGGGGSGQLATYDLAMGYQNLVGRMFGRDIQYVWDPATRRLRLERRFTATEQLAIHVFNTRPEAVLLADPYARMWLFDYTVAQCKMMMGEARGKFGSIAGPQGGITLNGADLKNEAKAEMERLDTEITQYFDAHMGSPFIIG